MTETVAATLAIQLTIECPHCEDYIDLMGDNIENLNDEGYISKQCLPDGCWHTQHEEFDEKVECPFCEKEIHIKEIHW